MEESAAIASPLLLLYFTLPAIFFLDLNPRPQAMEGFDQPLAPNSSSDYSTSPYSSFYQSTPSPSLPSSSFYQSPTPSSPSPASNLTIANLSYTVHPKRDTLASWRHPVHEHKAINVLKSVSFSAKSSEILAIVGPSGAGKSSLLRIISGRIQNSKFDWRTITLNDQPLTSSSQLRKICGFVTQEDNLLPLLTVKETLLFSSWFRLRGSLSKRERMKRIECLMHELGLTHVANSYIGDEETRGISGGERKRVSIGVDVIHNPAILLLDEPTTGLDSTSALQVIELLASMAKRRQQIVILTIHQPSYRILHYISTFLLLSSGVVAHCGSLQSLEETISQMGCKIPVQLNPLEYAMEIIRRLEDTNGKTTSHHFIQHAESWLVETVANIPEPNSTTNYQLISCGYCSRLDEIASLSWRIWKVIYRTKQLFLARTMQAIVGGFSLGSVYLNVKSDADGVAERLGLFAFSLSFLLSSTVEALPIFLQERRVLMREASRGMYRLSSYMVANTIVFVPFLLVVALLFAIPVYWLVGLNPSFGAFMFFSFVVWMIVLMASSLVLFLSAISPDFILGNSLICTFLAVFFLFSGYFIPKESIPRYWVFMYYVSLYKYPLDSFLVNEYWNIRGKCFSWQLTDGSSRCLLTGADVLKMRGLERDTRWMNVVIMLGFFLFYRLLSWVVLVRKASRTML